MKKTLICVILILLCTVSLLVSSCSKQINVAQTAGDTKTESKSQVLESVDIEPSEEYPQKTSSTTDVPSKQTDTFEFAGQKITANYESTDYAGYNNLKYNEYSNDTTTVQVYADNQMLKRVIMAPKHGNGQKTFEECKQIAIDYASQYISVDDYRLTFTKAEKISGEHYFDFTRYFDYTPTDDSLAIGVNTDGVVEFMTRSYSEAFSDGDFDIDKVRSDIEYFKSKEVHDELDGIAKSIKNYSSHQYFSNHLVSLGGKEYGLEYVINVDTLEKNSDGTFSGSGECLTYVVTRK